MVDKDIFKIANIDFTDLEFINSFIELQNFILEKQNKNEPFFIGRLSGNETLFTANIFNNNSVENLLSNMLYGAGINFSNTNSMLEYANLYHKSVLNCDLLGVWDNGMHHQAIPYYEYLLKNNITLRSKLICARSLEPYYFMNHEKYAFYEIFKNKKVLVISSHLNTVNKQLEKTDKLFNHKIFHETTSFYVYKPPQQNAGNNDSSDWKHHFETIQSEIKKIKETLFDFDIALVSCGGFGMITCDYINKELNASVIYIGGALQLFFGIIGNRWLSNETITKCMNDNWTRVVNEDKPINTELCESSCYW
jgi:hypothetical protein